MLFGSQYKQYKLSFIGIWWTNLMFLDPDPHFLSTSLWLVVLIKNVHMFCQNCLRTWFAGSHIFSCLPIIIKYTVYEQAIQYAKCTTDLFWLFQYLQLNSSPKWAKIPDMSIQYNTKQRKICFKSWLYSKYIQSKITLDRQEL